MIQCDEFGLDSQDQGYYEINETTTIVVNKEQIKVFDNGSLKESIDSNCTNCIEEIIEKYSKQILA